MKALKAVIGNLIERFTGNTVWVDEDWNKSQTAIPDKKSWLNLLVFFPLFLVLITLALYLLFE